MGALYNQLLERLDRVTTERDEARDEVERLKEEVQNVNNRYEVALVGQRQKREQRDKARAEVEQLKQALHDARLENSGQAALLERKRPEPSRLEIAALLMAHSWPHDGVYNIICKKALDQADALIAAAKEGK